MKRIILVVSLVFISIFIFSFKEKESKEKFIDEPIEIGFDYPYIGGFTQNSLSIGVAYSTKKTFNSPNKLEFNIYIGQKIFFNDGTPGPGNYFNTYHNIRDIKSRIALFSKAEASFFVPSNNENENYIYQSDFIDITRNNSFIFTPVDSFPQNSSSYLSIINENKLVDFISKYGTNFTTEQYLEAEISGRYREEMSRNNPINIILDPILFNPIDFLEERYTLNLEIKLTFSDELVNSGEYFEQFKNNNFKFDSSMNSLSIIREVLSIYRYDNHFYIISYFD